MLTVYVVVYVWNEDKIYMQTYMTKRAAESALQRGSWRSIVPSDDRPLRGYIDEQLVFGAEG